MFMMVLQICNTSADQDISAAKKAFKELKLANYPGENVDELATEALRFIKIMQGGYALEYSLGTQLLTKVTKTSCEYFNRTMFDFMDSACAMKDRVGESKDPTILTMDPQHPSCGLVALCSKIREEYHVNCWRLSGWPALATQVPAANNATDTTQPADGNAKSSDSSTADGSTSGTGNSHGSGTGTTSTGSGNGDDFSLCARAWKYIWPHNENQEVTVNGTRFKFCKFCCCRRTRKVGFYVTTHSTSSDQGCHFYLDGTTSHGPNDTGTNNSSSFCTSSGPSAGNVTTTTATTMAASTTASVLGNHSPTDTRHVDTDPDGLFFEGAANMVETISDTSALWLSPDVESFAHPEELPELWMASIGDDDADDIPAAVGADAPPASTSLLWYCQDCSAPGFPYRRCVHECGDFNFV